MARDGLHEWKSPFLFMALQSSHTSFQKISLPQYLHFLTGLFLGASGMNKSYQEKKKWAGLSACPLEQRAISGKLLSFSNNSGRLLREGGGVTLQLRYAPQRFRRAHHAA